jgi:hypothetical protein
MTLNALFNILYLFISGEGQGKAEAETRWNYLILMSVLFFYSLVANFSEARRT